MRRSYFLPLVSAALLLGLACGRSYGQNNPLSAPPTGNVTRRAYVPAPPATRTAVQSSNRPSDSTPDVASDSHHKSWKDLAHNKSDGKADKPNVTFSPWSAAGALGVVVALILVVARLFRRHAPMFQQSLPQEALEILGRRFVDPRQTILLVRIGARILVVGSSTNGLNSLGQIDDPVEVDLLAGMCRRGPQAGTIATSFFKMLKGESAARVPGGGVPPAAYGRQTAARRPTSAPPLVSELPNPQAEGLSQPEYDLVRRLRGAAAVAPTAGTEGIR